MFFNSSNLPGILREMKGAKKAVIKGVRLIVDVNLSVFAVTVYLRLMLFRNIMPNLHSHRQDENHQQTVRSDNAVCDQFPQCRGVPLSVKTQR